MLDATGPAGVSQLIETAVDQACDMVIVVDAGGIIRAWNRMATQILGFTADEAIGRHVEFIVPEKLRGGHNAGFGRAIDNGKLSGSGSVRRTKLLTADGGSVFVDLTGALVADADGTGIGSIAIGREVPADK